MEYILPAILIYLAIGAVVAVIYGFASDDRQLSTQLWLVVGWFPALLFKMGEGGLWVVIILLEGLS